VDRARFPLDVFTVCAETQLSSPGRIPVVEPVRRVFPVVHTPYYYD